MPNSTRAVIIGMAGPALSVLGAVWVLVNVLIDTGRELTVRYVIFDPGHLAIVAGIMVSVICIPVAFEVAAAAAEDVELELFEPERSEQPSGVPAELPGQTWETAE